MATVRRGSKLVHNRLPTPNVPKTHGWKTHQRCQRCTAGFEREREGVGLSLPSSAAGCPQAKEPGARVVLPPPPPPIDESQQIYRVEAILDSRRRCGRLDYLIDREEHGPEEQSWVARDDILDPGLLRNCTSHTLNGRLLIPVAVNHQTSRIKFPIRHCTPPTIVILPHT